jgi:hypothetical protein
MSQKTFQNRSMARLSGLIHYHSPKFLFKIRVGELSQPKNQSLYKN